MMWNWQQKDWPKFSYDKTQLDEFESQFLKQEGMLLGAFKHLDEQDKTTLRVEIITNLHQ